MQNRGETGGTCLALFREGSNPSQPI